MAYKQLDRDGDGIVTYDEFKESFGPKSVLHTLTLSHFDSQQYLFHRLCACWYRGFDLGLSEPDMKDLILSIDQEGTGFIECDVFLKRLREVGPTSCAYQ